MANLIIQEDGVARTAPAVHGEEITIQAPCDCTAVTGVQINGVVFPFCDACGNHLAGKGDLFSNGSLIRVMIDTVNTRATILNRGITPANIGAARVSTVVTATLAAANWSGSEAPYTYALTVNGVTATSNQELLPSVDITKEQLAALQAANIQDGGQTAGSITLKAFGDVPTIDIPIRVIKRGD